MSIPALVMNEPNDNSALFFQFFCLFLLNDARNTRMCFPLPRSVHLSYLFLGLLKGA